MPEFNLVNTSDSSNTHTGCGRRCMEKVMLKVVPLFKKEYRIKKVEWRYFTLSIDTERTATGVKQKNSFSQKIG